VFLKSPLKPLNPHFPLSAFYKKLEKIRFLGGIRHLSHPEQNK